MAKPCKVTIKTSKSAAPKEMSFEDYMDMLYGGMLEQFINDGFVNTNKLTGDNPFAEQPAQPKKKGKEKKSAMSEFMKARLGEAYGDLRQRRYGERLAEQRGIDTEEYISVDQKSMQSLAEEKFQQLRERYESGEQGIFDELLDAHGSTNLS